MFKMEPIKYETAFMKLWIALALLVSSLFSFANEAKAQSVNCPTGPSWCACVARSGFATNAYVAPTYNRLCGNKGQSEPYIYEAVPQEKPKQYNFEFAEEQQPAGDYLGSSSSEIVEELCRRRLESRVKEYRRNGRITFSPGQVDSLGSNFYSYAGEYHVNEGRRTTSHIFPCKAQLVGSDMNNKKNWRIGVSLAGMRF